MAKSSPPSSPAPNKEDLSLITQRLAPRAGRQSEKAQKPLYQVMKKDMERAISTGQFAPGSRVPSESELIAHYQVSSTTARRCLDELEHEGLLRRVRGKGTFVSDLAAVLQNRQVAVLVKDLFSLSHPFISQVLGAIEKVTDGSSVHLNVQRMPSVADPDAMGKALVSALQHSRTEFALVLSNVPLSAIQTLLDAGIHCLGVNTRYQDERIPHIAIDFEAQVLKSIRTVTRLGHKHLAFFVQEPSMEAVGVMNSSSSLLPAWAKARVETPVLPETPLVVTVPYPFEEHLGRIVEEVMSGPTPPSAIIASDEVAGLEIVRHLRRIGFDVPKQVSVIGSKLLPFSELAVLEAPLVEMAAASARAIMDWVDGRRPQNRLFPPGEFLPRETVAPPPDDR